MLLKYALKGLSIILKKFWNKIEIQSNDEGTSLRNGGLEGANVAQKFASKFLLLIYIVSTKTH